MKVYYFLFLLTFLGLKCAIHQPLVLKEEINFEFENNDPLALGNISNAKKDSLERENFLMEKPTFVLSYNTLKNGPNWVSWVLTPSDMGSARSDKKFFPDQTLPDSYTKIKTDYYTGSGFTRGHNCPAGDRTADTVMHQSTYVMTNIIPQTANNNNITWNNLEQEIRCKVQEKNQKAYTLMGHYGLGGLSCDNKKPNYIDQYNCALNQNNKIDYIEKNNIRILVPERIFKIVLFVPMDTVDYVWIDKNREKLEMIVVDTPNSDQIDEDWTQYIVSLEELEENIKKDTHTSSYQFLTHFEPKLGQTLKKKKYTVYQPCIKQHSNAYYKSWNKI